MRKLRTFQIAVVTGFCLFVWGDLCRSAVDMSQRFTLVLEGQAVADNTTGLIWEQEPDRIHDVWEASVARPCNQDHWWPGRMAGAFRGRAARPSSIPIKEIPPCRRATRSPISNRKFYRTATPHPTDDIVAWQVSFFSGEPVTDQKSGMRRMWCVLGDSRR